MTRRTTAYRFALASAHVALAALLLIGTMWPFESSSLLPSSLQFRNWPFALQAAAGLLALACVAGDLWFFSVRPPQHQHPTPPRPPE